MAESKLVQLNLENTVMCLVSYLCIEYAKAWPHSDITSYLVIADLFMHLLPGLILLYLAVPFLFYTEGVFKPGTRRPVAGACLVS